MADSNPAKDRQTSPEAPGFRQRLVALLHQDVWDIEILGLSRARRLLIRAVRIVQLVFRGFKRDECMLHASSLTFISMLAIVPLLALSLSMARVFGAGDLAREQLKGGAREWFAGVSTPSAAELDVTESASDRIPVVPDVTTAPDAPLFDTPSVSPSDVPSTGAATDDAPEEVPQAVALDRIERLIDAGFERVENLNFKALGGLGVFFLIWSVISVLGRVEAAFNRVWGVSEHRPLLRKFTDYLSVVIVFPTLVITASSIPAVEMVMRIMDGGSALLPGGMLAMRLLKSSGTVILLTLSFSFLLRFVPNTRVRTLPSLAGGLITAILMLVWLKICAAFQLGVAKQSLFFGSFATVPVLLSWVYMSWGILLFGAEVSFAVQNADTYRMELEAARASLRTRWLVAADLLSTAAAALRDGDGLLHIPEYVRQRRVSVRLVNDVVHELTERQLLAEVTSSPGAFAVRHDVLNLTLGELGTVLMDTGVPAATLGLYPDSLSPLRDPLDRAFIQMLPQRIAEIDLQLALENVQNSQTPG